MAPIWVENPQILLPATENTISAPSCGPVSGSPPLFPRVASPPCPALCHWLRQCVGKDCWHQNPWGLRPDANCPGVEL